MVAVVGEHLWTYLFGFADAENESYKVTGTTTKVFSITNFWGFFLTDDRGFVSFSSFSPHMVFRFRSICSLSSIFPSEERLKISIHRSLCPARIMGCTTTTTTSAWACLRQAHKGLSQAISPALGEQPPQSPHEETKRLQQGPVI